MTLDELKLVLEQVEDTWVGTIGMLHDSCCEACRAEPIWLNRHPRDSETRYEHAPDCRYVRVKKLLEGGDRRRMRTRPQPTICRHDGPTHQLQVWRRRGDRFV
jgi:hypothetical protein